MKFNFNIFDNDLILTLILTNSNIAKIKRGTMLRQTAECGEDRDKKISSIDQQAGGTRLSQSIRSLTVVGVRQMVFYAST